MKWLSMRVSHRRLRQRQNAFQYTLPYLAISGEEIVCHKAKGLFAIDKANLFSLRSQDFGDRQTPPVQWLRETLSQLGLSEADGEVELLTLPRILGFAFNPVSFWFCLDRDGQLRAVIAEVNNTFGERHCYACFHHDHRPIVAAEALSVRKIFHVSPFLAMNGTYQFYFDYSGERIVVRIDLHDEQGLALSTSLAGRAQSMSVLRLLSFFLSLPWQAFKVIALIHYQGARLYFMDVRCYRKPMPPDTLLSH